MIYEMIVGKPNTGKTERVLRRMADRSVLAPVVYISDGVTEQNALDRLIPMLEEDCPTFAIGIYEVDVGSEYNGDMGLGGVIKRALDELPDATHFYLDMDQSVPIDVFSLLYGREVTITKTVF